MLATIKRGAADRVGTAQKLIGNGHRQRARKSSKPKPRQPTSYYATAYPAPSLGHALPPAFAKQVRKLESLLKMPVWMLIQNGDDEGDFCCSAICIHALRAFQGCRALMNRSQPAALLIDSPGGDAHYAYTIARFFQRRTSNFTVIVPRYAKSAATLIALGASELILGRDAELGPLDVQMLDRDRENRASALDAVQSLDRLNVFAVQAVDFLMFRLYASVVSRK